MRRHLLDLVILFVVCSIVAIYIALGQPSVRGVALHAYVLVVGGLIMLGVVAAAGDAVPKRHRSEFDRALGESVGGDKPVREVDAWTLVGALAPRPPPAREPSRTRHQPERTTRSRLRP